jgi:platelet-activating factor acetylhydrolase IB subunit alpha
LWNVQAGNSPKSLDGHMAWVMGVALYDQGARLASASADRTVRLWELTKPQPPAKK